MMNITNLISYFTGADKSGQNVSKVDTLLEYNLLGQFLSGNGTVSDGKEAYNVSQIEVEDKNQLQELYNGLKSKYAQIINNTDAIKITDDNVLQYAKILTNFQYLYNDSEMDETEKQSVSQIKNALYQYVLNSKYELDEGLGVDDINYDFVINQIIQDKNKPKDVTKSESSESEANALDDFAPSNDLELSETDMETLMRKPEDGMFAFNSRGVKIVYENKHYYSPDYPDIKPEKNIYGLNYYLNLEFVDKIEKDLRDVFGSNKTESEKKAYVADFVNKFKDWAYNSNRDFLYSNGIKPGTKERASISGFAIPFVVGEDYTPQFDIDSIYNDLAKKYSE